MNKHCTNAEGTSVSDQWIQRPETKESPAGRNKLCSFCYQMVTRPSTTSATAKLERNPLRKIQNKQIV